MDEKKFKNITFEEFRNPWFWFYLISLVIFTFVWFIPIPWKTINIVGAFGTVISQLIFNLKAKMDEKISIFSRFIRWAYFIVLLLFAITYTSAILKEITISVITLLITFGAILLGAVILNFSNLFKSRWPWGIISSYLALAFTSIFLFGFIFTITSALDSSKIVDPTGKSIDGAWNYVSFSSSIFYSNTFGEVPSGISKLFAHIELAFSFIVHIIVLGFIINSKTNELK
ncbi:hypothetical protein HYY70_01630 [Candidatus Woesearchaeota archaeon]|nr:hypothetical protein [Candidatus Woesearchaeota archaeon]